MHAQRPLLVGLLASTLVAPLAGCDSGDPTASDAGTSELDAPSTNDGGAGAPDTAVPALDAAPRADAGPLPAFDVPRDRTWHYVELEGAMCANGSPLGIALNLDPSSDRVLVFLQGGGACWDVNTCLYLETAAHLTDTLDEATVIAEAEEAGGFVLSRDDAQNPYRDQSFVYVPYCTGDVHVGDHEVTYSTPHNMRTIQHRGARNVEIMLARLAATYPALDRLTLSGESAGGYGVAVNAFRGRLAFPGARVDVLDDSGIIVDAMEDQWAAMLESWAPPLPSDCPECLDRLSNILPYYARTMREGERFAIFASRTDETIRTYFGYSPEEMATRVDAMVESIAPYDNEAVFVHDGSEHVLLRHASIETSDGVSVPEWVAAFANDDPSWGTVGP